jgi:hypothetical protein
MRDSGVPRVPRGALGCRGSEGPLSRRRKTFALCRQALGGRSFVFSPWPDFIRISHLSLQTGPAKTGSPQIPQKAPHPPVPLHMGWEVTQMGGWGCPPRHSPTRGDVLASWLVGLLVLPLSLSLRDHSKNISRTFRELVENMSNSFRSVFEMYSICSRHVLAMFSNCCTMHQARRHQQQRW